MHHLISSQMAIQILTSPQGVQPSRMLDAALLRVVHRPLCMTTAFVITPASTRLHHAFAPHIGQPVVRSPLATTHKRGLLITAPQCQPSMTSTDAAGVPRPPCRVLVLGGSGRVGSEAVRSLLRVTPHAIHVTIAGRDASRAARVCTSLRHALAAHKSPAAASAGVGGSFGGVPAPVLKHQSVDVGDWETLRACVGAHDVVVHAAGPFQGRRDAAATRVLAAALEARVAYVDVCDDVSHALACKALHTRAASDAARPPALITTGIYPGVSNLMATHAVAQLHAEQDGQKMQPPSSLRLYYHTTGSGGIGPTVLASTFLLLSEDAVSYAAQGRRQLWRPASQLQTVDFGGDVGPRVTYALNLPEVVSLHDNLAAHAELHAKFSTGPAIWNWLLIAMARLIPRSLLANRGAMRRLAAISMPVVRAVDALTGGRTAIIVDAVGTDTKRCVRVVLEHESLAKCVGDSVAAFVAVVVDDVMTGRRRVPPGVWFPEELDASVRDEVLQMATVTCDRYETTSVDDATKPSL